MRITLRHLAACAVLPLVMGSTAMAGQLVLESHNVRPATRAPIDALIKGFEAANPDVKVKVRFIDPEAQKTMIRSVLLNDAPDITTWYAGNSMAPLVKAGLLEDISDLWAKDGLNEKFKSAAQAMTMDGKKWGVPWSYYPWAIFYRKDIFAKLQIAEPKTWAELVAASAKLKSNNITPFSIGTKANWTTGGWFDYLNMRINGYEFHMDLTAGKIAYTDKRVHAVFDRWDELTKPGYFLANHDAYRYQDANAALVRGDAAMFLIGSFAVSDMQAAGLTEAQLGFMQFPEIVKGVPMAENAPLDSYFIPAKARNKVDARRFLSYLSKPEVQAEINTLSGRLPVNKDAKMTMDVYQRAGFNMLIKAHALAQFYDRDTTSEMAKIGMDGFQQYMLKPDDRQLVLQRLEQARQRIYK